MTFHFATIKLSVNKVRESLVYVCCFPAEVILCNLKCTEVSKKQTKLSNRSSNLCRFYLAFKSKVKEQYRIPHNQTELTLMVFRLSGINDEVEDLSLVGTLVTWHPDKACQSSTS